MTSDQTQLLMAAIVDHLSSSGNHNYSGQLIPLAIEVITVWPGSYGINKVRDAVHLFQKFGMASTTETASGTEYVALNARQAKADALGSTSNAHWHPQKVIPLFSEYAKFGHGWLIEMWATNFKSLKSETDLGFSISSVPHISAPAPAADRIVLLDHNQVISADAEISKLVFELEKDNGDPEQPELREKMLGQIKAGREMVRAGIFNAYLLYATLAMALSELITRYKKPLIVALANALLGAVVSQLIQGQ